MGEIINLDGTPFIETPLTPSKPVNSAIDYLIQDAPNIEHMICLVRCKDGSAFTIKTPMHDDTYVAMTLGAVLSSSSDEGDDIEEEDDNSA